MNAVGGLEVEVHVGKFNVVQDASYYAACANGCKIIHPLHAKRHRQQRLNNEKHTKLTRLRRRKLVFDLSAAPNLTAPASPSALFICNTFVTNNNTLKASNSHKKGGAMHKVQILQACIRFESFYQPD